MLLCLDLATRKKVGGRGRDYSRAGDVDID